MKVGEDPSLWQREVRRDSEDPMSIPLWNPPSPPAWGRGEGEG